MREKLKISDLLVLLVEPSSTQQRIVSRLLGEMGISQKIIVNQGAEAIEQMRVRKPDLVISALYLPDMTGTELVYAMRESHDLEGMAFMLISSETRFRYLDPIRQAGTVAILPKPFTAADLRVALSAAVDYVDSDSLNLNGFYPEDLRVLIVDDSRMARNHVRRVLTSMGVEKFTEAEDGAQALKCLAEGFFDLVVTDYNMPVMDGQELVERIRAHSNQSAVPVLMVTSEDNENRLAAVQQSGVSAICDKPFEPATVRSLVQQII